MFLLKVAGCPPVRTLTRSMSYSKVTHVIFDLDGLLLDSECLYKQTYSDVIESFGHKFSPELRLRILGTIEYDTARVIVETLNLPVTPTEFCTMAKAKQLEVMGNIPLKPGAERLVNHLHENKVPIAIATSSAEKSFNFKTAVHKDFISKFHHAVKGSSDPEVRNGKPAPDVFLVAARRFPVPAEPEKCLVFEDAPNGLIGATAAGMQCVLVPEEYVPPELTKKATLVIKSLLDFQPEHFGLPPFPS